LNEIIEEHEVALMLLPLLTSLNKIAELPTTAHRLYLFNELLADVGNTRK
jgi:hypothetical protein